MKYAELITGGYSSAQLSWPRMLISVSGGMND